MSVSVKVYLRTDALRKDGKAPFVLRVTIDRKTKIYTLNQHLEPRFWDEAAGRVIAGCLVAEKINFWLQKTAGRATDILHV